MFRAYKLKRFYLFLYIYIYIYRSRFKWEHVQFKVTIEPTKSHVILGRRRDNPRGRVVRGYSHAGWLSAGMPKIICDFVGSLVPLNCTCSRMDPSLSLSLSIYIYIYIERGSNENVNFLREREKFFRCTKSYMIHN